MHSGPAFAEQAGPKVFKKLLEGEQEALEPEHQERAALNMRNYEFCLLEYQQAGDLGVYVLGLRRCGWAGAPC